MSIKRTISGTWCVRVHFGTTASGKTITRTKTVKSYKEAQKIEREFIRLKDASKSTPDTITLAKFYEQVFIDTIKPRVRASTWRSYTSVIYNHVLPRFGKVKLLDITRASIQNYLTEKPTHEMAKRTLELLRLILNVAKDNNYIDENPALGRFVLPARRKKDEGYKGAVLQTFAEHRKVIDRLEFDEVGLFVVLGLSTGMRKGEVLALTRQDIDLDLASVRITKTYTQNATDILPPKTFESDRTVSLPSYAVEWCKQYFKLHNTQGILFKGRGANKYLSTMTISKWIRAFFKDNPDLPCLTALTLRHSFATACINAGVPIEYISRALGHTSVVTTYNRYIRIGQEQVRQALSPIENAYQQ